MWKIMKIIYTCFNHGCSEEVLKSSSARDGFEGYNTALNCSPDIILLDVGLPVMDGYEAAKKIKSDLRVCHIPIIILTANALKEDRVKALQSGADEYEAKPINLPELLKKIEGLIHR